VVDASARRARREGPLRREQLQRIDVGLLGVEVAQQHAGSRPLQQRGDDDGELARRVAVQAEVRDGEGNAVDRRQQRRSRLASRRERQVDDLDVGDLGPRQQGVAVAGDRRTEHDVHAARSGDHRRLILGHLLQREHVRLDRCTRRGEQRQVDDAVRAATALHVERRDDHPRSAYQASRRR